MGRYTNPHTRLSELIALMSSEIYMDYDNGARGLTIRKIREITGIPENILKKDIEFLLLSKNTGVFIETDIEETDVDETNDEESYYEDYDDEELHPAFLKLLKEGKEEAADVSLGFDYSMFEEDTAPEEKPVFFTPMEKNIFAKVMHKSDISDAVWVKDTVFSVPDNIKELQNEIRIAIENEHPVSFRYSSPEGEIEVNCLNVRRIYETLDNKRLYCIAMDEEMYPLFYRLDRISDLKIENKKKTEPETKGTFDFLDHMWGAEASQEMWDAENLQYRHFHVKVKIFNETKNIYAKIKEETKGRKYGRLYKAEDDDNIFYYEDEISGKNSFKKWLRRYGASAVLMEPPDLAKEMYESALRRLAAYKRFEEEE